jgi:hypothetical protein
MDGDIIKSDRDLKPYNEVSLDQQDGSHRLSSPKTLDFNPLPSLRTRKAQTYTLSLHQDPSGSQATVLAREWDQSCLVPSTSQDNPYCFKAWFVNQQ